MFSLRAVALWGFLCGTWLPSGSARLKHELRSVSNSTGPKSMKGTSWEGFLEDGKVIGKGALGTASLHSLTSPCTGQVVAKEIRTCSQTYIPYLQSEVIALLSLQHPNILQLYDYSPRDLTLHCKPTNAILLTEPAMGGELTKVLATYGFTDAFGAKGTIMGFFGSDDRHVAKTKLMLNVLVDTLRGLNFMHQSGYLHRDIKPENIWGMTPDGSCINEMTCRFILGDLGISTKPEHMMYQLLPSAGETVEVVSEPSGNGSNVGESIKQGDIFELSAGWQQDPTSGFWYAFVGSKGWIPISDMDGQWTCAPVFSESYTRSQEGTRRYQPEETRLPPLIGGFPRSQFYPKSDVWALGISIEEAFSAGSDKRLPNLNQYSTNGVNAVRNYIKSREYLPEALRSLLWRMTEHKWKLRPSAEEALEIAEGIALQEFAVTIPPRVQTEPHCLTLCKTLPGDGHCKVSANGNVTRGT